MHHEADPQQLQTHHETEECEDGSWCHALRHSREKQRQQRCKNPMRGTAKSLSGRAMTVREDLADEDPDHRSLSHRMRGDERENAKRDEGEMLSVEGPGTKTQGKDVSERADDQQGSAAKMIDKP